MKKISVRWLKKRQACCSKKEMIQAKKNKKSNRNYKSTC